MASRWAASAEDVAKTEQRKQERLEKKRIKEERARQEAAQAAQAAAAQEADEAKVQSERPSKRRRIFSSPPPEPEAHLLPFPTKGFGPAESVDDFQILNAIEEGSYGKVSRARTKKTGEVVALKKLKINPTADEGFPITGLREIQTLSACSHLHIIDLRQVVVGPGPAE